MADLFERYFFDAMANLGQSLGQRSADNAVKRQSLKARSAIDDLLGSANEADVTAAMRGSQGQRYDLSRGTIVDPQYSLSNATPDGRNVQENAADEVLNLKRMGQYPILDKMGKNGEQRVNLLQNNGWQPPVAIEDVKLALRKQGADEDIIEKELGYYNSKIKEQANTMFVPQILDKYKNGDYTGALQGTLALRQYDPDTANVLLSGSVTPRDLYARGQEDVKYSRNRSDKLADQEQQHIWDLEAEYRKINTAKDMSLFNVKLERAARNWALEDKLAFVQRNPDAAGVVFGRGSGSSSGMKPSDIKTLGEIAQTYIESDNPELQKQGQAMMARVAQYTTGMFPDNEDNSTENTDWNNWNSIARDSNEAFNYFVKNGMSHNEAVEKVLAVARENLGDSDMYKALVNSYKNDAQGNNVDVVAKPKAQRVVRWDYRAGDPNSVVNRLERGDFGENGMTIFDLAHK